MPVEDLNFWQAIVEHTPAPLRWVLGGLIGLVTTLVTVMWRWNRKDIARLEKRITLLDQQRQRDLEALRGEVVAANKDLSRRMDFTNRQLMIIAQNTSSGHSMYSDEAEDETHG